jgi:hypothetical protein
MAIEIGLEARGLHIRVRGRLESPSGRRHDDRSPD